MGCFWCFKSKTQDFAPEPQPTPCAKDSGEEGCASDPQLTPWAEDVAEERFAPEPQPTPWVDDFAGDFYELGLFTGPGGEEIFATNIFSFLHPEDDEIKETDRSACPDAQEIVEINLSVRPDGEDAFGWRVDISVNGRASPGPVRLRDPFNRRQRSDCRWYIEDFVCKSPYSVTRARQITYTLAKYAESLVAQLGLVKLVDNYFASCPRGNRNITISVREDEGNKHSVHQLHWETLEDTFWMCEEEGRIDEITVKRIVISEAKGKGALIHDVTLDEEGDSALPKVNGLLVVARDLLPDLNSSYDVSPHLALGVLVGIVEDFKKNRSQAFLNLEVVRPGSLEALEKHLQRATEIHGKNYYHFVHLDVHGFVKSSDGAGYLKFNSPDPDLHTTVQEKAETVAEIIARHGVAVAVLNACESARADRGDVANIAKTFIQSGVKNVLGMSFEISSSAADLVLRAFYHSLFLEEHPFSHAASKAREVLRCNQEREGLLGLKRDLLDFFVPVVYSCGQDSRFLPLRGKRGSYGPKGSYYFSRRIAFEGNDGRLIGREFELLMLEKKLLTQGRVYLTGRSGIGKSAMLRHASRIWHQTSFMDIVLFLDFTQVGSLGDGCLGDVIDSMVSQIPSLFMSERRALWSEFMDLITSQTSDSAMFAEVLLGACSIMNSKPRLMIICDGLDAFTPMDYSSTYGKVSWDSDVPMVMLRRLMEALLNLGNASTPHVHTVYHILVSRLAPTRLLPFLSSEENPFQLPSLGLSDSIELSQSVLRHSGLDIDNWVDADLSELELLLGFLDGNPSAILHVLPQIMSQTDKSSREFRLLLQRGILPKSIHVKVKMGHGIFNIIHELGDEARDFLLLLSTLWHESMGVASLLEWTSSHNICTKEVATMVLVNFHSIGGLIDLNIDFEGPDRVNPGLLVTWIHPLLTICGRRVAYEILTERRSPSVAAALVLSTLGVQFDQTLISEQTQILCADFKKWFLQSVAAFNEFRDEANLLMGFDYQDLHVTWSSAAGNLATCLAICTRQPYLPIDQWPLEYFQLYTRSILHVGSPAQLTDFAKSFEQLFEIFINFNGSLAIETAKNQLFALQLVTCLTGIYFDKVPDAAKFEKYVDMGLQMVKESEERFGKFKDSRVRFTQGIHLRFHVRYLMKYGSSEQAAEVWNTAHENDKSIFEEPRSVGHLLQRWSPEEIQALAKELSNDAEAEAATNRLSALSANQALEAYHESYKDTGEILREIAAEGEDEDTDFATPKIREHVRSNRQMMEKISESFEAMGIRGIDQDESWRSRKCDIRRFLSWRGFGPDWNLACLYKAMSAGNSTEAVRHLQILLAEACENLELDEVEEYFNSLERYAEQIPLREGQSVDWVREREYLTSITVLLGILHGKSTRATARMSDPLEHAGESLEKLIKLLKERNAPVEAIKALEIQLEMWQKTDKIDRRQGIIYMSLDEWSKSIRRTLARAQNAESNQKWLEVNLRFQRHRQRMHEAELQEDVTLALERLEEMKEFLGQPGSEILEESHSKDVWCGEIRLLYEFKQVAVPVSDQVHDAFAREDCDEARRIITTWENDLIPKFREQASEWIAKWRATTEELAIVIQIRDAVKGMTPDEGLILVAEFQKYFRPEFR